MLAKLGVEDVDDDVGDVQNDPPAGGITVVVAGANPFLAKSAGDFFTDGFQVRLRVAGADDQVIGDGRDFADVEDDDLFGLFVLGGFPTQ